MNESTFTAAFRSFDNFASAVLEYYKAEAIANQTYAGAVRESAIADAAGVLQAAANRFGVVVTDTINMIIKASEAEADLPESVFAAGAALNNPNLSASVAAAIVKTYAGNTVAIQYLHDVAAPVNQPYVEQYMIDTDALTAAKKNISLIVDRPSEASLLMHDARQALRRAATCCGFAIVDTESEAYTDLRFKAISTRMGLI